MQKFLVLFFSVLSCLIQPLFASGVDVKEVKSITTDIKSIGDGTSTCMH